VEWNLRPGTVVGNARTPKVPAPFCNGEEAVSFHWGMMRQRQRNNKAAPPKKAALGSFGEGLQNKTCNKQHFHCGVPI
jgi:hypothetical protein